MNKKEYYATNRFTGFYAIIADGLVQILIMISVQNVLVIGLNGFLIEQKMIKMK
jgi:hypothetical protein